MVQFRATSKTGSASSDSLEPGGSGKPAQQRGVEPRARRPRSRHHRRGGAAGDPFERRRQIRCRGAGHVQGSSR